MVARTPPKQQRKIAVVAPHLSPTLLRETLKKVDKCVARLQELQYTVTSGVNLRCKREPLRIRNAASSRRSPPGKLPAAGSAGHWRRMSLPAMLLGETMGEVLQATQFASSIVAAAAAATDDDPKTPLTTRKQQQQKTISVDNSGLTMQARRRREKQQQQVLQPIRSENNTRSLQRAKSKINFKLSSPPQNQECNKENCRYIANRVSPRNKPWARKTVLFPNPLFHSSSPTSSQHQPPMTVARNRQTPHRFLIKSPPRTADSSKFQVKIKSPPVSISPTRASSSMRRSFSPSRLANRLISPLKNRKSVQKKNDEIKIKFTEIPKSYKFLIKSPPHSKLFQGKIKSSLVSISPNRTASFGNKKSSPKAVPKLGRSFSPSRLASRIASPLKVRNYMNKYEGPTKIISGNTRPTYYWSSQSSPQRV